MLAALGVVVRTGKPTRRRMSVLDTVHRPVGNLRISAYLLIMEMSRATRRPPGVIAPAHWTNDPVPVPVAVEFTGLVEKGRPDPVRYGDWELKGIAIDF